MNALSDRRRWLLVGILGVLYAGTLTADHPLRRFSRGGRGGRSPTAPSSSIG